MFIIIIIIIICLFVCFFTVQRGKLTIGPKTAHLSAWWCRAARAVCDDVLALAGRTSYVYYNRWESRNRSFTSLLVETKQIWSNRSWKHETSMTRDGLIEILIIWLIYPPSFRSYNSFAIINIFDVHTVLYARWVELWLNLHKATDLAVSLISQSHHGHVTPYDPP